MTTVGPTKDFFISYSRQDSAWAEWIAWQLENDGYSTIIQSWDFKAGSNFALEMDLGLKQARRVIAALSPHYIESSFTPSEWASRFVDDPMGTNAKLIPVRVPGGFDPHSHRPFQTCVKRPCFAVLVL